VPVRRQRETKRRRERQREREREVDKETDKACERVTRDREQNEGNATAASITNTS